MYQIRKKFKFEMAHILDSSYSKNCQIPHGHGYVCEVFLKDKYLNKDGMVVDFGKISNIVKEVLSNFDHVLLINKLGPWQKSFAKIKGVHWVNYNPTAENMCKVIFKELKIYTSLITLYKIRLHETETGYAEYWED